MPLATHLGVDDATSARIAFDYVRTSDKGKIFVRLPPGAKEAWVKMCEARKIDQNTAGVEMVKWLTEQDPLVQSMVLGQLPPAPELVRVVVERLAAAHSREDTAGQRGQGKQGQRENTQTTPRRRGVKIALRLPGSDDPVIEEH